MREIAGERPSSFSLLSSFRRGGRGKSDGERSGEGLGEGARGDGRSRSADRLALRTSELRRPDLDEGASVGSGERKSV